LWIDDADRRKCAENKTGERWYDYANDLYDANGGRP
jgi:hypothetical protein